MSYAFVALYAQKKVLFGRKKIVFVIKSGASHILTSAQPHIIWKIGLQAHKTAEEGDCHDDHPFCQPASQGFLANNR